MGRIDELHAPCLRQLDIFKEPLFCLELGSNFSEVLFKAVAQRRSPSHFRQRPTLKKWVYSAPVRMIRRQFRGPAGDDVGNGIVNIPATQVCERRCGHELQELPTYRRVDWIGEVNG